MESLREEWSRLNERRVEVETSLRALERPSASRNEKQQRTMTSENPRPVLYPSRVYERPGHRKRSRQEDPRPVRKSADEGRNRRMFGILRSHLGQARTTLDRDATIETKRTRETQVADKLEKQRREALRKKQDEYRSRKGRKLDERDEVLTELRQTERRILYQKWEDNFRQTRHFCSTRAEPVLCWRPSEHTDLTRRLLTDREDAVEALVAAKKAKLERLCQDLDDARRERSDARRRAHDKLSQAQTNKDDIDIYPPEDDDDDDDDLDDDHHNEEDHLDARLANDDDDDDKEKTKATPQDQPPAGTHTEASPAQQQQQPSSSPPKQSSHCEDEEEEEEEERFVPPPMDEDD